MFCTYLSLASTSFSVGVTFVLALEALALALGMTLAAGVVLARLAVVLSRAFRLGLVLVSRILPLEIFVVVDGEWWILCENFFGEKRLQAGQLGSNSGGFNKFLEFSLFVESSESLIRSHRTQLNSVDDANDWENRVE